MKKGLLSILLGIVIIFLVSFPVSAATYYGCATQEITAADTFKVDSACTGASLTWASLANGDILVANGYTISIANDIGSSSVTVTLTTEGTANSGIDGGGFTFDVSAVAAKTLYANIVAGTTDCLAISGAGSSGTELTIIGDITGGRSANAEGVLDTHTGAGATIVVTGNLRGGAGSNGHAYTFSGTSGAVSITGNVTAAGGTYLGRGYSATNAGTSTINGDCRGSDVADVSGCVASGAGALTVTGNIIYGTRGAGAGGNIVWAPSAATKYVAFTSGTDIYASAGLGSDGGGTQIAAADTAAKVSTGTYFVKKDDGVYTQGTMSAGGGGAWAY